MAKRVYQDNIFSYFFTKTNCGYSLEVPPRGTSNEYPQHSFMCRNLKNISSFQLKKVPCLELCTVIDPCKFVELAWGSAKFPDCVPHFQWDSSSFPSKYCNSPHYYIAINIEWLKICNRIKGANMQLLLDIPMLDIARLLECLQMLPLQDIAFDNILKQWHHTKTCHIFLQALNLR